MDARVGDEPDRSQEFQLEPADVAVGIVRVEAHFRCEPLGVQGPAFDERVVEGEPAHSRQVEFLSERDLEVMAGHRLVKSDRGHDVPGDRVTGHTRVEGSRSGAVGRARDVEAAAADLLGNDDHLRVGGRVEDAGRGRGGRVDQPLVFGHDRVDARLADSRQKPAFLSRPTPQLAHAGAFWIPE